MRATKPAPSLTASDRLGLALLLATVVHAGLILGISFDFDVEQPLQSTPTLDVVLLPNIPQQPPEEAEVLAESDRRASGRSDHKERPSSPPPAPPPAAGQRSPTLAVKTAATESQPRTLVTRQSPTRQEVAADASPPAAGEPLTSAQLIDRSLEIARLTAELESEQRRYAKRPRIHTIDSLSAKSAVEASYVAAWVRKVERVGNLNYPDQARRRKLGGSLILNVLINHDGEVVSVEIGASSGHRILDDAAVRIVTLASPFAVFPPGMRAAYDQLMITRSWVFYSDSRLVTK